MSVPFTIIDLASLSPFIILLCGMLTLLLIEAFASKKEKGYLASIAAFTIVMSIVAVFDAPTSQHTLLTHWVRFDWLAKFFNVFFLSIGLLCVGLSVTFFKRVEENEGEYFALLLSALIGLMLIGSAADFLTLFIGLETLSIALYVLCGYLKEWRLSHESAVKYFLIGSIAAALLLNGIAFIYGALGTTRLENLLGSFQAIKDSSSQLLFLTGTAFVTLGLAFKSAIVPFHFWAPDVYEGAPTPVTAFMAVGTKAGAFAAFIVVFILSLSQFDVRWNHSLVWLVYPTLLYANFVALRQKQLRRFFAYSSISHAGFMLMALVVGTPEALTALLYYLVIYSLATLGCFSVLGLIEVRGEGALILDFKGFFKRCPWMAALFAFCLLTLAGIPFTAGFIAKFYIFKVTYQAGYHFLVILALLTAILSAYYYLRIVGLMMADAEQKDRDNILLSWPTVGVSVVTGLAILVLSIYSAPLIEMLEKGVKG